MRFLANENFPGAAVIALEAAGHDVVWVRIAAPGMTDPDVLAWAAREERILLTFDKDFGELAGGSVLPRTCGVIWLRTPMPKPGDVGQRLADLITGWLFLRHRARPRSDATDRIVVPLVGGEEKP